MSYTIMGQRFEGEPADLPPYVGRLKFFKFVRAGRAVFAFFVAADGSGYFPTTYAAGVPRTTKGYPVFLSHLEEVIKRGVRVDDVSGVWVWTKRGTTASLRLESLA